MSKGPVGCQRSRDAGEALITTSSETNTVRGASPDAHPKCLSMVLIAFARAWELVTYLWDYPGGHLPSLLLPDSKDTSDRRLSSHRPSLLLLSSRPSAHHRKAQPAP